MLLLPIIFSLHSLALAVAVKRQNAPASPTVVIPSPDATILGSTTSDVESFIGVPFAQPPVGQLRLKPPQALTNPLGTINATATSKSCPQFAVQVNPSDFPAGVLGYLIDIPFFQNEVVEASEDCLTVDIRRPAGTTPSSKLPVLFWIYGGAYEVGATSTYNFSSFVSQSINTSKPIITVSVSYRVGGFGFLPGNEIKEDGAANLGLLDQRLGLQWVADNIEAFGGDPTKVTIWGESAGAWSTFQQMIIYDGDNTYNGQPLFRGAIMDSGSVLPVEPVDGPRGQQVFDTVVAAAGCNNQTSGTLDCLRNLDYTTFLNAVNSVPAFIGYQALNLAYQPRPDGKVITDSPDAVLKAGKYAKVPFIVGDQEDEGTLFALFQDNITTTDELVTYWNTVGWQQASRDVVQGFIDTYPDDPSAGSPFRTADLYNWYPQYKRMAAIIGDTSFTLTRRFVLDTTSSLNPSIPSWSYLSSYDHYIPYLGTLHGSDLLYVVLGDFDDYARNSFREYYYNFIYNLDPNVNLDPSVTMAWPQWSENRQLLWYPSSDESSLITDDFRNESYAYYVANIGSLLG